MVDILFSYDHRDRDRAALIKGSIERAGWQVWWDEDMDLVSRKRETLETHIKTKLKSARGVVVLWTPNSVQSSWVRSEARFGLASDKLIQLVDGVAHHDLPEPHGEYLYGDFSGWQGESAHATYERLIKSIDSLCKDPTATDRPKRTVAQPPTAVPTAAPPHEVMTAPPVQPYIAALPAELPRPMPAAAEPPPPPPAARPEPVAQPVVAPPPQVAENSGWLRVLKPWMPKSSRQQSVQEHEPEEEVRTAGGLRAKGPDAGLPTGLLLVAPRFPRSQVDRLLDIARRDNTDPVEVGQLQQMLDRPALRPEPASSPRPGIQLAVRTRPVSPGERLLDASTNHQRPTGKGDS